MESQSTFVTPAVQPPSQLYIAPGGGLLLTAYNRLASVVGHLTGRILTRQGQILPYPTNGTPTTNRQPTNQYISLPEGYLLSAICYVLGATPTRGQLFTRVSYVDSILAPVVILQGLIQDYITYHGIAAWPGGLIRTSLEGPGVLQRLAPANPAAGADLTIAVPLSARYTFLSLNFTLTNDANVANRTVRLVFSQFAGQSLIITSPTTLAATGSAVYQFLAHYTPRDATIWYTEPAPDHPLDQGGSIATAINNLQVGDQISAVHLTVEEHLDV